MNIEIKLKNYESVLNEYNENKISEALDRYIIDSCRFISSKSNLNIKIKGIKNKIEQEKMKEIIHNHYKIKLSQIKKIDQIDDYIRLILLIYGIIAIFISENFTSLLSELFLILGWVIVWEITYDLLFNTIKRKRKAKLYEKLAISNITFY